MVVGARALVSGTDGQSPQSYRLENFARAAEIYKELRGSSATVENEQNDLRINGSAVDAQLEWKGQGQLAQKKKPTREDMEAFETAYNAACGSIARGELSQGEVLLRTAKSKSDYEALDGSANGCSRSMQLFRRSVRR